MFCSWRESVTASGAKPFLWLLGSKPCSRQEGAGSSENEPPHSVQVPVSVVDGLYLVTTFFQAILCINLKKITFKKNAWSNLVKQNDIKTYSYMDHTMLWGKNKLIIHTVNLRNWKVYPESVTFTFFF